MKDNEVTDNTQWIKPLATFECVVTKGNVIEIPAYIKKALRIKFNDIIEFAYAGLNTDEVVVFNALVGARDRIGLRTEISNQSNVDQGDIIIAGILSIYHNRSENLIVVFDVDAQPGTV